MTNIFAKLQQESSAQKETVNPKAQATPVKALDKDLPKALSKDVKKDPHTRTHTLPTADVIEEMVFQLRKVPKVRVNGDLPEVWKAELDEYAHQSGVGKYHLVMYAVGKLLGKI